MSGPLRSTLFHASRHLDEDALLPRHEACRGCGATDLRATGVVLQQAPLVRLLRCAHCELRSADRMPTDEALDAYYASYYDADAGERVTLDTRARFGAHLAGALATATGARLRILDLGGGDGTLAVEVARAAGRDAAITVVDSVEPLAAGPAGVTLTRVDTLDETPIGSFDLVIASAILEHLPRPGDALDACVERLAPGGVFYARTPWAEPLARRLPSFDLGFPGHLHDMGAPFWDTAAAARAARVDVVASRPSIVENSLRAHPLRAAAAWLLKAPAHVEGRVRDARGSARWWTWVGGWEVLWQRRKDKR